MRRAWLPEWLLPPAKATPSACTCLHWVLILPTRDRKCLLIVIILVSRSLDMLVILRMRGISLLLLLGPVLRIRSRYTCSLRAQGRLLIRSLRVYSFGCKSLHSSIPNLLLIFSTQQRTMFYNLSLFNSTITHKEQMSLSFVCIDNIAASSAPPLGN